MNGHFSLNTNKRFSHRTSLIYPMTKTTLFLSWTTHTVFPVAMTRFLLLCKIYTPASTTWSISISRTASSLMSIVHCSWTMHIPNRTTGVAFGRRTSLSRPASSMTRTVSSRTARVVVSDWTRFYLLGWRDLYASCRYLRIYVNNIWYECCIYDEYVTVLDRSISCITWYGTCSTTRIRIFLVVYIWLKRTEQLGAKEMAI